MEDGAREASQLPYVAGAKHHTKERRRRPMRVAQEIRNNRLVDLEVEERKDF